MTTPNPIAGNQGFTKVEDTTTQATNIVDSVDQILGLDQVLTFLYILDRSDERLIMGQCQAVCKN